VRISIVVAAAENGVIGQDGGIPWRLRDDQKYFKALTLGHCIVMGRGTYESIGRLLPGRTTIVVTRNPDYGVPGALVAHSLGEAIELAAARGDDEAFVVGGASLYLEALPIAHALHLTRVHAEIEGDVHFPDPAAKALGGWKLTRETPHPRDERNEHAFTIQVWERPDADGPALSRS
jgi:dihydrofolate reductase